MNQMLMKKKVKMKYDINYLVGFVGVCCFDLFLSKTPMKKKLWRWSPNRIGCDDDDTIIYIYMYTGCNIMMEYPSFLMTDWLHTMCLFLIQNEFFGFDFPSKSRNKIYHIINNFYTLSLSLSVIYNINTRTHTHTHTHTLLIDSR